MFPATSPKKRSLMPSGKLRQSLRGHGHRLSAIVQVGKVGVTPGLLKQLEHALDDHELVKVKVFAEGPTDRFAVAERLAELPGVNIVQIVGGAILLYKRHPRVANFEGRRALGDAAPPAAAPAPARSSGKDKGRARRTGKDRGKRSAAGKSTSKGRSKDQDRSKPRTPRRSPPRRKRQSISDKR
jgi:RNA-binding protein